MEIDTAKENEFCAIFFVLVHSARAPESVDLDFDKYVTPMTFYYYCEVKFASIFFLSILSYVAIITIRSSHTCSDSINKSITPLIAAAFVAGVNWISSVRAHANHIIWSGCSFIIRYLPSINFMRFLLQCQSSSLEMEEREREVK